MYRIHEWYVQLLYNQIHEVNTTDKVFEAYFKGRNMVKCSIVSTRRVAAVAQKKPLNVCSSLFFTFAPHYFPVF